LVSLCSENIKLKEDFERQEQTYELYQRQSNQKQIRSDQSKKKPMDKPAKERKERASKGIVNVGTSEDTGSEQKNAHQTQRPPARSHGNHVHTSKLSNRENGTCNLVELPPIPKCSSKKRMTSNSSSKRTTLPEIQQIRSNQALDSNQIHMRPTHNIGVKKHGDLNSLPPLVKIPNPLFQISKRKKKQILTTQLPAMF
jgi:hypothetical protein